MTKSSPKSQSELPAFLKEEEDTARQLYYDWVATLNPQLFETWKAARDASRTQETSKEESSKENLLNAYKACAASGDERKRSAYAAHLMAVGAKQCRLNKLYSDVQEETQSAIHAGIAKTIAYADPDHGSITGYLRTVVQGEKNLSLLTQALPLTISGKLAWADIHKITKETKKQGVILNDEDLKKRLTQRTWSNGKKRHTGAAIEEAMRYRALGIRAFVPIDSPTGRNAEDDTASLRAQKIEFAIFGANKADPIAAIDGKKFRAAFLRVAHSKLSGQDCDFITAHLLEGRKISDFTREHGTTRQTLEKRRQNAIGKLRRGLSEFNDLPKPPPLPRSKPSPTVEKKRGTVAELTYKRVFGLRVDSPHTMSDEEGSEFMRRFHQTAQEKLTTQQRQVVTALLVEGKATKDVAVAMKVSESSVSKWKSAAAAVLRRELADLNKDCKSKDYWLGSSPEKPFTP